MVVTGKIDIFAQGLRSLGILARHAPLDLSDFARLNGLPMARAAPLVEAFEQGGYVRRVPYGNLYVLTQLAIDVVVGVNPPALLVSGALDPVIRLACDLGQPVTFHIPKGSNMMCCLTSSDLGTGGLRPGECREMDDCLSGIVHRACGPQGVADPVRKGIRASGYGIDWSGSKITALAVPVIVEGRSVAVLTVHFSALVGARRLAVCRRVLAETASRLAALLDQDGRGFRRTIEPMLALPSALVQ